MQRGGTWHLVAVVAGSLTFATIQSALANEPVALARMVVEAEAHGDPLTPRTESGLVCDLRSTEFVGRWRMALGTVQIAQFSYVRSGGPNENPPPRGYTFVLFFDGSFRLRTYWEVDSPLDGLHLAGTVLRWGEESLFDFAHPSRNTILVDGKEQVSPALAVVRRRPSRLSHQHQTSS